MIKIDIQHEYIVFKVWFRPRYPSRQRKLETWDEEKQGFKCRRTNELWRVWLDRAAMDYRYKERAA